MSKIQAYYDYFSEYYEPENWDWYKNLSFWSEISQNIKSKISETDFEGLGNNEIIQRIEEILKEKSNEKINTIAEYCQQFLFESDNGISRIRQQLITIERRKAIIDIFQETPEILVEILKSNNTAEVERIVREVVVENANTVIYRFLRTLFPDKLSAPDAPQRLEQRINIINSKLGEHNVTGNILEKHQKLMELVIADDDAKKQMFFWEIYDILENSLNLKKAIVYYGAPGTGKTYKAKKVAKQFIDQHRIKIKKEIVNDYQIKTIQFHPSYSYEDFIEGIRPSSEQQLELFNGTFKEFCKLSGAKEMLLYRNDNFRNNKNFEEIDYDFNLIKVSELDDTQKQILDITEELPSGITIAEVIEPAFFIIDEINRAELSRVFGELMYSLEYRGFNGRIKTQYSYLNKKAEDKSVFFWHNSEDWFFIPQNIFLIGTMNNIDRSVDSFDFALRRRFTWEEVQPDFNTVKNILTAPWKDDLALAFEKLNEKIEGDELLGKDYRIGHSYALDLKSIQNRFETVKETKEFLWSDSIKPLIEEYLRGLGSDTKSREKLQEFKRDFGL